jgi:hypothetical protein
MIEDECVLGNHILNPSKKLYVCNETGIPCNKKNGKDYRNCKIWKNTPTERLQGIGTVRYQMAMEDW